MVHRFKMATLHAVYRKLATVHGYYVTPGNVAGIYRGAPGVNIGGENRGDGRVGGWWAVGREGEGTARGREEGHYIHGREKAHIHAKVPTLRSLLLRHTRHCNPLSIYTRIYI